LQGVGADFGIVCGKSAVAKNRMKEQGDRSHGNNQPVFLAGLLEIAHDGLVFCTGGVNRNQVVVMKIDAPGSNLRE
jgi:hypothetical protein